MGISPPQYQMSLLLHHRTLKNRDWHPTTEILNLQQNHNVQTHQCFLVVFSFLANSMIASHSLSFPNWHGFGHSDRLDLMFDINVFGYLCRLRLTIGPKFEEVSRFPRSSNHRSSDDCSLVFRSISTISSYEVLTDDCKFLMVSH